jgi:transposase
MTQHQQIIVGVDTHADTHHAAVLDPAGRLLGSKQFTATAAGYQQLAAWIHGHGQPVAVGVEGTGTYGAGLTRYLRRTGIKVIEVNRPNRRVRRARGKSDPIDAEQAARAVLSGQATATPKSGTGIVEAIRLLRMTRDGAVKSRTAALNQLKDLIVTAPEPIRERLRGSRLSRAAAICAGMTTTGDPADPTQAATIALASIATRIATLSEEIDRLSKQLQSLVARAAPRTIALLGVATINASQLLATAGDNPQRLHSEAAFAALCAASPIPASSGKTNRHRINPGGDRNANRALHMIAVVRMRWDPNTRAYVQRRTAQGLSKREIIRCLKRYIARQLYHTIHADLADLQPAITKT